MNLIAPIGPTFVDLELARREKGWTETRTRVALSLYNSGRSAAEVANEIGGVSRNAVIGKIHRAGAGNADRKANRAAGQARAERRQNVAGAPARGRMRHVRSSPPKKTPPKDAPPPSISDQQIPPEQRRTLAQLDNSCCHWPVGDPQSPDFFFCGAPKANDEGIAYCLSHLFRSQSRDAGPRKAAGAAFLNAGPNAPWRAR